MHHKPLLGCIADDFTGATDLASFLVQNGMRTLQLNGLDSLDAHEQSDTSSDFDAVVIALKSRTIPVANAVSDSLQAMTYLQGLGCRKYFFKYCSTFDSLPTGNIGPVTDALMARLGIASTLVCPALPVNGRSIYMGHLFVHGQLLAESPMKDHPLTPMKDSSIPRLIEQQGKGKAVNVPYIDVEQGNEHLEHIFESLSKDYRYIVPDALNMNHLRDISRASKGFKLITGGSGLALNLRETFFTGREIQTDNIESDIKDTVEALSAPAVILSGSCSAMTQTQVQKYAAAHPARCLDARKIAEGGQSFQQCSAWVQDCIHRDESPLVYSTANAAQVSANQNALGIDKAQTLIEGFFSDLARECINLGVRNILVAGGETSGAVVSALKLKSFEIGATIAPGVPLLRAHIDRSLIATKTEGEKVEAVNGKVALNLVLKSGNFGQENFFENALKVMKC